MTDKPKLDFKIDSFKVGSDAEQEIIMVSSHPQSALSKILRLVNGMTMSEVERRLTAKCETCSRRLQLCDIRHVFLIDWCDEYAKNDKPISTAE